MKSKKELLENLKYKKLEPNAVHIEKLKFESRTDFMIIKDISSELMEVEYHFSDGTTKNSYVDLNSVESIDP